MTKINYISDQYKIMFGDESVQTSGRENQSPNLQRPLGSLKYKGINQPKPNIKVLLLTRVKFITLCRDRKPLRFSILEMPLMNKLELI